MNESSNAAVFWRGFLKGLGDPTAVIWGVAFAAPAFAYFSSTHDALWRLFFAALGFLCWLVIVGSWMRRRLDGQMNEENQNG